jgi:hypothetical protein
VVDWNGLDADVVTQLALTVLAAAGPRSRQRPRDTLRQT